MADGRVFCAVFFILFFGGSAEQLQVNTTEGVVEGARGPDGDYFVFYDIPYAGPTSGEYRFKGPSPPRHYTSVFRANNRNIICAQPSSKGLVGTEDCLTLSIYTQNVTTQKPVLVWLNTQEFTTTPNSMESYKSIIEEGIVVVKLNFRLSIFGFLCLGVPEAPGNAGLKDIIQGLTWIKANIANFGGQPNNVILIGHGSGAALVDIITMSPKAENLVHKAIALSGSALAASSIAYDPIGYAKMIGTSLGYTNKPNGQLAKLFKETEINLLISSLSYPTFANNTPLFAPCVEKLKGNDTVLADAPLNLLKSGKFLHIPYISGFTSREGTIRAEEAVYGHWLEQMQANFTNFLPVDLKLSNATELSRSIRKFYFSERAIDMGTIEDYLEYHGDTLVLIPTIRGAKERGAMSTKNVWLLELDYRGTYNSDWPYNQIPVSGARHGSFLNYLLDKDLRRSDEPIRRSLLKRMSNFAFTGQPNAAEFKGWDPVTNTSFNYLLYGGASGQNGVQYIEEPRMNPHTTRMTFWNDIYSKYYVPPQPSSAIKRCGNIIFVLLSMFLFIFFCV